MALVGWWGVLVYLVVPIILVYAVWKITRPLAVGAPSNTIVDFLTFKDYLTPAFVSILYGLGAYFITVLGLLYLDEGLSAECYFGMCLGQIAIMIGFFLLVFMNLAWRLICEYIVLQFRIYGELASMNSKLGSPARPPADAAALRSTDEKIGVREEMRVTHGTSGAPPAAQSAVESRKCGNCGAKNRSTVKFCTSCGATLPKQTSSTEDKFCGECGARTPATSKFCVKCGTKCKPVEGPPPRSSSKRSDQT